MGVQSASFNPHLGAVLCKWLGRVILFESTQASCVYDSKMAFKDIECRPELITSAFAQTGIIALEGPC